MKIQNTANGEPCPISGSINIFGGKWKPEILHFINIEPRRFNELRRLIPRVSGGLIPAYELLINNNAVSNLIREKRTHEIIYGNTSEGNIFHV